MSQILLPEVVKKASSDFRSVMATVRTTEEGII